MSWNIFSNQQYIKKGVNMNMNFILFKVYVESFSKWSNLKVNKDKYERVIDFGYWRFFIS